MGRLTVFTNRNLARDKVYAVPKEKLESRDAMTYVFQGTVHAKGLLTHGILRGHGQNIIDDETFATTIRKSELEKLAYVIRLRRNERRVPIKALSPEPISSPSDSGDELDPEVASKSALVHVGSDKRARAEMQDCSLPHHFVPFRPHPQRTILIVPMRTTSCHPTCWCCRRCSMRVLTTNYSSPKSTAYCKKFSAPR